jgi:lipopolysaccharide transport system permease protein
MLSLLLKPFTSYKYLLFQLTQREIKARYKQSFIGYAWVLLNPLAQLVVYSFVFSVVFRFPSTIPYPIFLFSALLPWTFLQNSITSATQSLVNNDSLLKKINFPREIIPYSVVFSKLVDLLFSGVVFVLFLLLYRVPLAPTFWLVIPLLLIQLLLTTGLSLFLAAANLFYRDIQYLANLLVMLWMYMTPIVYPVSMVPNQYLWLYKLNPMVGIIEGYRSALFGYPFEWSIVRWSAIVSVTFFVLSFILFKKLEKVFADIV